MKAFLASGAIVEKAPFTFVTDYPDAIDWINGIFTKIAVYVESEEELLALEVKAREAGLPVGLIQDNGLTEFKGIPTHTALGIGPANAEAINSITGHLPLF